MVQQRSDREYWLIHNHYVMKQHQPVQPKKFENNNRYSNNSNNFLCTDILDKVIKSVRTFFITTIP